MTAVLTTPNGKTSTEVHASHNPESVFAKFRPKTYPYRYKVTLRLENIVGGTPTDPKVAENWLKFKLAEDRDDVIRDMVMQTMVERGLADLDKEGAVDEDGSVDLDSAIEEVSKNRTLNGFKRSKSGELYIEGRQVKAMIKENANIQWPRDRWGKSNKGTKGFFAEHVFIEEDVIGLGVTDPTEIQQRFVSTWRGTGIQLEERVDGAEITFHVVTDHKFTQEQWATLFLSAEYNGLGAARSQGFGRFATIAFEKVEAA